jgi:uncharacterized protein
MLKYIKISFAVALAAFVLCVFLAGEMLSQPAHTKIGNTPADLAAQSVEIQTAYQEKVSGWVIQGKRNFGVILLLHGVRSNCWAMVNRARFLNKLGYSVLLIDLPAHGESSGEHITYGFHESEGVSATLSYIRQKFPTEKIGVIGTSLGAASFVLSHSSVKPDAVVLESMFPTIEDAVKDRLRLRLGALGEYLTPLLLWQLPLRVDVSTEQLRPIVAITSLHMAVLIAAGAMDEHTTLSETKHIFESANPPKELWIVEGAAHVDLHRFNTKIYEEKVSAFLDKYLHSPLS